MKKVLAGYVPFPCPEISHAGAFTASGLCGDNCKALRADYKLWVTRRPRREILTQSPSLRTPPSFTDHLTLAASFQVELAPVLCLKSAPLGPEKLPASTPSYSRQVEPDLVESGDRRHSTKMLTSLPL